MKLSFQRETQWHYALTIEQEGRLTIMGYPSETTHHNLEQNAEEIVDGKSKGKADDFVVILSETEPTEVLMKEESRLPTFDTVVPPRDYPGVLQPLFEE